MSGFDLFLLLLKRYLRLFWVIGIFALLFAVVLFVGFVKGDLLDSLYDDILKHADADHVSMTADYSPDADLNGAEVGIYSSKAGETYDVTLLCGETAVEVNSYSRGLNISVILPVWQTCIEGEKLSLNESKIWLYRPYATRAGISLGDMLTVKGNSEKTYTVSGFYTSDINDLLLCGYTPSFLLTEGGAADLATVVCPKEQIFSLSRSDLRRSVTGDGGAMDLCDGYEIAHIGLDAVFFAICLVAVFLQIRMMKLMDRSLSCQSFLLSVFGLSGSKKFFLNVCILALFGLVALAFGVGIFYIFIAVTEALSKKIMNMVFGEISIGLLTLLSYLVYVLVSGAMSLIGSKKTNRGDLNAFLSFRL